MSRLPEPGSKGGTVIVDTAVIKTMESFLTGRTDETLNDQFGISYNTWRKLQAGIPIRVSLAGRLLKRLECIVASNAEVNIERR